MHSNIPFILLHLSLRLTSVSEVRAKEGLTATEDGNRRKRMARLAGVDLPNDKRVEIGLTAIYGIGRPTALEILKKANVDPSIRVKDLSEEEVGAIRKIIDSEYEVEGELRREVSMNIKRLMEIGCYRGIRHRRGLPVRGQKTKTNARTRKGPKKTVGRKKK